MIKTIILCLMALSTVMASDVFSVFYNSKLGGRGKTTHYSLSNPGCFQIPAADRVMFDQGAMPLVRVFHGPYCLIAYKAPGCHLKDVKAAIEYSTLDTCLGYKLKSQNLDASNAASYKWTLGYCHGRPVEPNLPPIPYSSKNKDHC